MGGDREQDRNLLLNEIIEEVRDTYRLTGRSSLSTQVLEAMRSVPRHAFVPEEFKWAAYKNTALGIGHCQTISQPYVVALMTDLINPKVGDVVLEIGTGSGYQAAVVSCLVKQVYSLEIIEDLACKARERLQRMRFSNVEVLARNGRLGWPEHAPYDAIIVTAASELVPSALLEQIKPGGVMVIPIGNRHSGQDLKVIRKDINGRIQERSVLPVVFVPLIGSDETQEIEASLAEK